jgi:hypothetical protein
LAGAAQLIAISALVGADPIPATWSSVLLAVAPAPVAALARAVTRARGRCEPMTGYLTRDRTAIAATPLAAAAVLLPFRSSWSNTKAALLLVAVALAAGAPAASTG